MATSDRLRRRPRVLACWICTTLLFSSSACIEGFESPSLYGDEPTLCNEPSAKERFEERLARCWSKPLLKQCDAQQADSRCGCFGLLSLLGEVDGRRFRFDSEFNFVVLSVGEHDISWTDAGIQPDLGADPPAVVQWIVLTGAGPYFRYGIRLEGLPGVWSDLPINGTQRFPVPYRDVATGQRLRLRIDRLEAQGESTVPDLSEATGWIEFQHQSAEKYRVSFDVRAPETYFKGCFATRLITVQ